MIDRTFECSPQAVSRLVGDTMVLLDLHSDKYFGLPNVGARIWTLLGQGSTVTEVAAAVAAEYEVSVAEARKDVDRLADELVAAGLLLNAGPSAPVEPPDPPTPN